MIEVMLNGEMRSVDPGLTIAQLLEKVGVKSETVVVERNGKLVTREHFGREPIAAGDRLELVRIVGGG